MLEEIHGEFHLWIGGVTTTLPNGTASPVPIEGDMASLSTAAFDPIFFFHHSFVDYMYAEWQTMI